MMIVSYDSLLDTLGTEIGVEYLLCISTMTIQDNHKERIHQMRH